MGIHSLNIDKEIKELKIKERKLHEGIARNMRDRTTAERLKRNLAHCQQEIAKLKKRQQRLANEIDNRRYKKDIF